MRIMTFNIRGFSNEDGVNNWENRAPLNVRTIRKYMPDLIGFQELENGNLATYQKELPQYEHILGPKASNNEPYNYDAIFWLPSCLELLDSGGFWLNRTSEQLSSDWGAHSVRAATWAKFREKDSGKECFHFNTHLDHVSDEAEIAGSKLIVRKVAELAGNDVPVFVTGDFNCSTGSLPYSIFMEHVFVDTYLAAGNVDSLESNTHNAFGGTKPSTSGKRKVFRRFDWILLRDTLQQFRVRSCEIIKDQEPPVYPSDHYSVLAEVVIK